MANKALESTVLSIEVETAIDKDGNPTFSKKKIGNLVANAEAGKIQSVADLVAGILEKNTGYYYVTEVSQIESN
ncbi:DUF1659 domain-containing protein [Clostridium sp. 1001271B_151109_B4]|uniref:DUF1659 domain-containing protein n=1 Tax=Clostridium sp. 1001271B_151109_B4 TaxID=2787148 RepID=UPI0018A9792E|nr:DUF1659 domain-containing protein [Clostridium sp. 1001271B_151109_B4]